MKTYRRKRQQYWFAGLLGIIGAVNLLFFFILYRPARAEYFRLQDSILASRGNIQARRQRIARLEKLNSQLGTSAQDRQHLIAMYFIPKDKGWSEVVPHLDRMVRTAGVRNTRKEWAAADTPQYGLFSVKARVPVSGAYPNVVKLIKDIEQDDTFFIIESIDVRESEEETGTQGVSMNLNLETFFYQ